VSIIVVFVHRHTALAVEAGDTASLKETYAVVFALCLVRVAKCVILLFPAPLFAWQATRRSQPAEAVPCAVASGEGPCALHVRYRSPHARFLCVCVSQRHSNLVFGACSAACSLVVGRGRRRHQLLLLS
jgi:hypothetical protein